MLQQGTKQFFKIIFLCISLSVFYYLSQAPILDRSHCLNNLESTLCKDVWNKKSKIVGLKLFFPPLCCPTIPLRLMIWTNWIYPTLRCCLGKTNIFKDAFYISSCKYRSTQCGSTLTTGIIILTSVYLHYPLHLHKLKLLKLNKGFFFIIFLKYIFLCKTQLLFWSISTPKDHDFIKGRLHLRLCFIYKNKN